MNTPVPDRPPLSAAAARLAARIDHTLLRTDATRSQVLALCAEAVRYGFAAVCVAPCRLALAAEALAGSAVKPGTVIGFPQGFTTTAAKAFEAERAAAEGAAELDMVLNVGALKDGALAAVREDIAAVACAAAGRPVKVILETHWLTDAETQTACRLAEAAGAHYVKTSTGLFGGGATEADVRLMRAAVGTRLGVKASGGIRTRAQAEAMLRAGADRIGTSAGVAIVSEPDAVPERTGAP